MNNVQWFIPRPAVLLHTQQQKMAYSDVWSGNCMCCSHVAHSFSSIFYWYCYLFGLFKQIMWLYI